MKKLISTGLLAFSLAAISAPVSAYVMRDTTYLVPGHTTTYVQTAHAKGHYLLLQTADGHRVKAYVSKSDANKLKLKKGTNVKLMQVCIPNEGCY